MARAPILQVDGLRKAYASRTEQVLAIEDVQFTVAQGEFMSIVGPSGCGKSTLLMIVAGLLPATAGTVRLRDRAVTEPVEGSAIVFQDYARSLFPWLSARANVALPLRGTGKTAREIEQAATRALEAVGLVHARDRYPWQLSGGMQQRVAIARALAMAPSVLLMDEPFASVDAQTRVELEDLLLQLWEAFGMTVVFVTHDIDEAVYLSDRVIVLSSTPARVVEEVKVVVPRPRNQILTKQERGYLEARERILGLVMPRVRRQ